MAKKDTRTKAQKRTSAIMRNTDYIEQQKKTDAPFGRTFKTGGHKTDKHDGARVNTKRSWRRNLQ